MLSEKATHFSRLWQLLQGRPHANSAEKLYRGIVAQTRLRPFYADFGVPDTLEGRYLVLSLHVFAVLERLRREGVAGAPLGQDLIDQFTGDMDTVMRELGVSDLRVPKKVRALSRAFQAALPSYERALQAGKPALAAAIAGSAPGSKDAAGALAAYLTEVMASLERQSLGALQAGEVSFPPPRERA